MKTHIINISASKGIHIPKMLLEESRLGDKIELVAEDGKITIRAAKKPRDGWYEAFLNMSRQGDDKLLDNESIAFKSSWDEEEWQWE